MRKLNPPTRDVAADYDTATAHRNVARRALLTAIRPQVLDAYGIYTTAAPDNTPCSRLVVDEATAEALKSNFDLVSWGRPLATLREDVLARTAPTFGRCPMCEINRVSAIDHYLPRGLYPEFAILAPNLIPVCERCNRIKGEDCLLDGGHTYFQSYLDIPLTDPVLIAEVQFGESVGVDYRLDPPAGVDAHAYEKYATHFEVLGLRNHYTNMATNQLQSSTEGFHLVFDTLGAEGLRTFLAAERDARLRREGPNNWEAALYRCLASSVPFYTGGYQKLLKGSVAD